MKRLAERSPGRLPNRGYLAACAVCGLVVVHAASTGQPFHMHRDSKACADRAAKLRAGLRVASALLLELAEPFGAAAALKAARR